MLTLAFFLFLAASVGGVLMTTMLAKNMDVPAFMGKGHGLTALAGLAVLFAACLMGEGSTTVRTWLAFFVFLGGFMGGALVIAHVFFHKPPMWFTAIHASAAVLGLGLLLEPAF